MLLPDFTQVSRWKEQIFTCCRNRGELVMKKHWSKAQTLHNFTVNTHAFKTVSSKNSKILRLQSTFREQLLKLLGMYFGNLFFERKLPGSHYNSKTQHHSRILQLFHPVTGACKRNPDFFGVQKLIFVSTCSSRRGLSDKLNFQFRHPAFFQSRNQSKMRKTCRIFSAFVLRDDFFRTSFRTPPSHLPKT